jgi:CRP-like cAMP-binding protein
MPHLHALQGLNYFKKFSDTEIAILQQVAVVRHFKKKQDVLATGEIEQYISCVAKGLVSKYIMCNNKPLCTEFAAEGNVVCSNSSFGSQLPSEYGIEAVENTTLISFTIEGLEWLYQQSPVFFEFGKIIVASSFFKCEEREIMLMKYDAQNRFNYFMETKGDLFLRLPQTLIASYLNIQPETFSKLKRYYIKNIEY